MDMQTQIDRAQAFHRMHDRASVLLPNAWDAGSARLLALRGFAAVATTSGGVAWSLGYANGERAPLATIALGALDHAAQELRESARFGCLASSFSHPDAQQLFEPA
ncbi:MAG: isocitrate lyase/phosphoenolpyruvate mutase family protein [Rhodanobacter sp.]